MNTGALVASVILGYVRSHTDTQNPNSPVLWWSQGKVIELHQSVAGDAEVPGDGEFVAFSAAVATWQKQLTTCGSLSFTEGARTTSRQVGYFAGQTNENVSLYRTRACKGLVPQTHSCQVDDNCGNVFDCWQFDPYAIAITTTSFNMATGQILDGDIEYNMPSFVFSAVDAPVCQLGFNRPDCVATDVQNTTTHELGHLLGLAHSADGTMSKRADPGELSKRVLDASTAQFVCDVYPLKQIPQALGPAVGCSAVPVALMPLLVALFRRRTER